MCSIILLLCGESFSIFQTFSTNNDEPIPGSYVVYNYNNLYLSISLPVSVLIVASVHASLNNKSLHLS